MPTSGTSTPELALAVDAELKIQGVPFARSTTIWPLWRSVAAIDWMVAVSATGVAMRRSTRRLRVSPHVRAMVFLQWPGGCGRGQLTKGDPLVNANRRRVSAIHGTMNTRNKPLYQVISALRTCIASGCLERAARARREAAEPQPPAGVRARFRRGCNECRRSHSAG